MKQDSGPCSALSLLVLQAVMFASIPFINIQALAMRGFASRKEAHFAFFAQARHLYELQAEEDSISMIQAALILSTGAGPEQARSFLRRALLSCHRLGLDRRPEKDASDLQLRS
ncbi:hypothetical protein BDW75DRAFT_226133 [Aspergillus navahoensis]